MADLGDSVMNTSSGNPLEIAHQVSKSLYFGQ